MQISLETTKMPQSVTQIRLEHIYAELRSFMRSNKIRSKDLARVMNRTEQAISNQLRRQKHFTSRTAMNLSDAFEKLGFPINKAFLLTGNGLISDNPDHNPSINVSFSSGHYFDKKEESLDVNAGNTSQAQQEASDTDDAIIVEQILRERDEIYDKYLLLLAENKALKKIIADATEVLNRV